jgi:hypothetical protein
VWQSNRKYIFDKNKIGRNEIELRKKKKKKTQKIGKKQLKEKS